MWMDIYIWMELEQEYVCIPTFIYDTYVNKYINKY